MPDEREGATSTERGTRQPGGREKPEPSGWHLTAGAHRPRRAKAQHREAGEAAGTPDRPRSPPPARRA
eukprot:12811456-Alexandrium_andersonii.AAC.1